MLVAEIRLVNRQVSPGASVYSIASAVLFSKLNTSTVYMALLIPKFQYIQRPLAMYYCVCAHVR